MRCYEVTHKIVEGIPLVCPEGARPYAPISGRGGVVHDRTGRVRLSDELADKLSAAAGNTFAVSRLFRCEFERTSELWLTPERDPSPAAIVLFSSHVLQNDDHGALAFNVTGDCSVLDQCEFARDFDQYPSNNQDVVRRKGRAALARMLPGTSITAVETFERKSFRKGTQFESVQLATVSMREDGRLNLEFHKSRAEYIFKVAAGAPPARYDDSE